jgi:RHS repeat-associated protein
MAIIKKRYYTIDGEMIGYKDASGRKDFLTDALGSVTAEVNQTGSVKTFDGRYKPFGETLWSVGIKGIFGWFGAWGYRNVGLSSNSHYVRYRHYSMSVARWTTPDPLFDLLRMKSRGRVRGTPLSLGRGYKIKEPWRHPDYFGLQPGIPPTYSGIEPGGWLGTPGIGGDVGLLLAFHGTYSIRGVWRRA